MANTIQKFAFNADATGGLLAVKVGATSANLDPTAILSANQTVLDGLLGAGNSVLTGDWTAAGGLFLQFAGSYANGNIPKIAYTSTLSSSATPSVVPSSGLVLRWKLDEGSGTTAGDSAGTDDGTLNGGAGWVGDRPVQLSGASSLAVDGVAGSNVTGDDSILPLGNSDRTISVWFKATNPQPTWGGPNDNLLVTWGVGGAGAVSTGIQSAATVYGVLTDTGVPVVGGTLDFGTWHNLLVTMSGSGGNAFAATVYLDGVSIASGNISPDTASAGANGFIVGGYIVGGGDFNFLGAIADVTIFDRVLTGGEITALAGAGGSISVTQTISQAGSGGGSGSRSRQQVGV